MLGRPAEWFKLQMQFKLAPAALLRVGRHRIFEFLDDTEYREYLLKLDR